MILQTLQWDSGGTGQVQNGTRLQMGWFCGGNFIKMGHWMNFMMNDQ